MYFMLEMAIFIRSLRQLPGALEQVEELGGEI